MQVIDVSLTMLAGFYLLVAVPLALFYAFGIRLTRRTLISLARMSVQLGLVGLYLSYIFRINSPLLSAAWILVMIVVANVHTISGAGLRLRAGFLPGLVGLTVGTGLVVALLITVVIRPAPLHDARYLVPISGMVLGNCLRGNVLALERFYTGIRDDRAGFLNRLLLGATLREAARPYLQRALTAALLPTLSTMATIGIVSLPGMMTGQILGGSSPAMAIRYQILIMLAIFVAVTLASVLNIELTMTRAFSPYGMPRDDVFAKQP